MYKTINLYDECSKHELFDKRIKYSETSRRKSLKPKIAKPYKHQSNNLSRQYINKQSCNHTEKQIINDFYFNNKYMSTGGLKTAKKIYTASYQADINADLYERIPISVFLQKQIQVMVKNTINIFCKRCGSDNVYCKSVQLRCADEATTKIFTCLNCGQTWRID